MSDDLNFPGEEYSPQSFGAPVEEKKSRSGRNVTLLACGGCMVVVVFVCCCCLALSAFSLRQPIGLATMWGAFISSELYETTDWIVCEGSQAARYTAQLENQDATFSAFSVRQDLGDEVIAEANLVINGSSSDWRATFFVEDGGTFGRCISRIEVRE